MPAEHRFPDTSIVAGVSAMRVLLSSLWPWLRVSSSFSSLAPRRPRARRRAAPVRLGLELLEDRSVPSAVTVTSVSDDPGDTGSLRYALNHAISGETIDFAADVRTISLSNTLNSAGLTIGVNLTIINDQGVGPVTIDGGRHLTVQRGSSFGPPARPQLANLGDIGDLLVAYPGSQFVGIAAFREAAD
jgi:hypothetical protein